MRLELSFSDEEHDRLKFRATENDTTVWELEGDQPVEVVFSPRAHMLVVDALEKLDKEHKLTDDYISVCDKFMRQDGNA